MQMWTLKDLQGLFGRVMLAKLREAPSRHQIPGRHHAMRRGPVNPAGTKLMKKWFGKDRIREALKRRVELIKEIVAVEESEPNTGRMAHGIMKRNNEGALLRIDHAGYVVAQFDNLKRYDAFGWHRISILDDFKLDKPSLVETIVRRVRG